LSKERPSRGKEMLTLGKTKQQWRRGGDERDPLHLPHKGKICTPDASLENGGGGTGSNNWPSESLPARDREMDRKNSAKLEKLLLKGGEC